VLENVRIALQRRAAAPSTSGARRACSRRTDDRALELLASVGLAGSATTLAAALPYGRKRALEIATTLALDPEVMLLDEPTAGMGHEDIDRIAALIKTAAAGRTVLMVEHNLSRGRPTSPTTSPCWRAARCWPTATTQRCRKTRPSSRPTWEAAMLDELLGVERLQAWYGESHVLHGVTFASAPASW
jgi:ABC-type branched-subunit amino acid transport system ATPase component